MAQSGSGGMLGKAGYKYLYQGGQKPAVILQNENAIKDGPFNHLLFEKALHRARSTTSILKTILEGTRTDLTSGGDHGKVWMLGTIGGLSNAGLLPQEARAYYDLPPANPKIGFNPAPYALIHGGELIQKALAQHSIRTRIVGCKRHLTPSQLKKEQRAADVWIAIPGDLVALHELSEIMVRKYEGASLPPLIIESSGELMDKFLASLQILEFDNSPDAAHTRTYVNYEKLAQTYGIYITHDRNSTINLAKSLNKLQKVTPKTDVDFDRAFIPENAVLVVATKTRKKYDELMQIYSKQGLKASLIPVDLLVDSFISPKEVSGSYEGNTAEKLQAAHDAWNAMKPQVKIDRLISLGRRLYEMGHRATPDPLKESEIFFIAEDSGFHFLQNNPHSKLNISTEPEFTDIAHQIHPESPFPGVETGPGIFGDYGPPNFFKKVGEIFTRWSEAGIPVTRKVIKKSIIGISQLEPPPGSFDATVKNAPPKMIMYSSETKGTFVNNARPAGGSLIDNFLCPEGSDQTEAELGDDWITEFSPRALAWKGFALDQKIPRDLQNKKPALREKEFNISIVTDESHEAAQTPIKNLVALNRLAEFKVKEVDGQISKLGDVQRKFLDGSDAVVLAFDPKRAAIDYWRNIWVFSSLVVGEQTGDKFKFGKRTYVVNPKDENGVGAFDYLENIMNDLHHLGTIPQQPNTLASFVPSVDVAVEKLKEDREEYFRYEIPAYATAKDKIEPKGEESTKEFNVAIFISASNENADFYKIGSELATRLTEEGFGVFSGAGLYSGMGAITQTLYKITDSMDPHHTGFTVPHIMDGGEVQGRDIHSFIDHFHLCRDIYERIEGLLTADAVIVAPGGMGTIQELAGFAFLKELALKNPDDPELQPFLYKELVVINTPIKIQGKDRGFYDVFLDTIPKEHLEALGIHTVNTTENAVGIMKELAAEKHTRLYLQNETAIAA